MTKKYLLGGSKKRKLSKEERELLKSIEDGEWESISDLKSEQKRYQTIAKNSLKKDKRINIRLATKDFMGIQKKRCRRDCPIRL